MGFWARDKADQEDRVPEGGAYRLPEVPSPKKWTCGDCCRTFVNENDYQNHRFDGHSSSRPVLTLLGRELDRDRPLIAEQYEPSSWAVIGAIRTYVNGERLGAAEIGKRLSSYENGVTEVRLVGDRVETAYELRFDIANSDDLDLIDDEFLRLAHGERLTVAAISRLIEKLKGLRTGAVYLNGLTDYLYGVLVRDRSPESGLAPEEYRDKYVSAAEALRPFRRPVGDTVAGLVAFHFNHLDEARARSSGARVAAASRRLKALELGNAGSEVDVDRLTAGDLEFDLRLDIVDIPVEVVGGDFQR